jgi:hypothetical protein
MLTTFVSNSSPRNSKKPTNSASPTIGSKSVVFTDDWLEERRRLADDHTNREHASETTPNPYGCGWNSMVVEFPNVRAQCAQTPLKC